jgi:hypothetical protein
MAKGREMKISKGWLYKEGNKLEEHTKPTGDLIILYEVAKLL